MSRKIHIFDTTLRDGEQAAGGKLNKKEKVELALQLAKLNPFAMEVAFPCSSPQDLESAKSISKLLKGIVVVALARSVKADIDTAWEAIQEAELPRIHVFLATSKIHLDKKLRRNRKEAIDMAVDAVAHARSLCNDVQFSMEDATRTDIDFLFEIVDAVIEAGATVINVPDTVGYALPDEYGALIKKVKERVPDHIKVSAHCHNDLGLAVANSVSAICNGADQVECTMNGTGERAGNAALEEIVMILQTRYTDQYHSDIVTRNIAKTSRMVSRVMNIPIQPNKAIVGSNAFAHSSGIHQDGMLKDRRTYEIIKPEDLGIGQHKMVLTARSGRAALKHRLSEIGFTLDQDVFERVYQRFIDVADRKKEIGSEDLRSIVEIEASKVPEAFSFDSLQIMSGNRMIPLASVTLKRDGVTITDAATGNGPVNAAFNAIERMVKVSGTLRDYDLRAVTKGGDALGEAMVRVEIERIVYSGIGTSPDVIEASARAYLNAFNRFFANGGAKKLEVVTTEIALSA